jgi:hypothetical protein
MESIMATKQEALERHAREKNDLETLTTALGSHVLQLVGRPADFFNIQVRRLWAEHFRVNVLVGKDATSACVARSFFVSTDAAGNIVASTPPLPRGAKPTGPAPSSTAGAIEPGKEPPCATAS